MHVAFDRHPLAIFVKRMQLRSAQGHVISSGQPRTFCSTTATIAYCELSHLTQKRSVQPGQKRVCSLLPLRQYFMKASPHFINPKISFVNLQNSCGVLPFMSFGGKCALRDCAICVIPSSKVASPGAH